MSESRGGLCRRRRLVNSKNDVYLNVWQWRIGFLAVGRSRQGVVSRPGGLGELGTIGNRTKRARGKAGETRGLNVDY